MLFCQLSNNVVHILARLSPWCPEVYDRHTLEVNRKHLLEVFRGIDCNQVQRHGDTDVRCTRDEGEGKVQGGASEPKIRDYLIAQPIQSHRLVRKAIEAGHGVLNIKWTNTVIIARSGYMSTQSSTWAPGFLHHAAIGILSNRSNAQSSQLFNCDDVLKYPRLGL